MKTKNKTLWLASALLFLSGVLIDTNKVFGQGPPRPSLPPIPIKGDTTHTLTRYFAPASKTETKPDQNGFIQRWLVLEPVRKNIARNNMLTEAYVRETFAADNFSPDFNVVPKANKKVKLAGQELKWYALDSKTYNFNLYHFTYAINKPPYGNLFWLVTVINCPEEIKNVRFAAGVNSGAMFWLNGKEAMILSGDRDMVVDNVTSPLLTLKKGKNILRGAVINGPGMCNFSIRVLDEDGVPVKNFTISQQ